jgi:GNAT superfamily N-acetyltransferase
MNIRLAQDAEAKAIADIYTASFKAVLPTVKLVHSDSEIRQWFKETLIPGGGTWVAEDEGALFGFMALDVDMLEELYVVPEARGKGIGSLLLKKAKQLSPKGLKAYTFQVNTLAKKFYEKHGFVVAGFSNGERNEEKEPDVLYEWRPTD